MARLDDMVDLTPDTRDRYMDFLRAASITVVVFGHWFISVIVRRAGIIYTTSAIGVTRGLWIATWFFQVMPIFFFVGGFSNLVAYESNKRKGGTTFQFLRSRLRRLLRPSLVFLFVWIAIQVVLHLVDAGAPAGPKLWGNTQLLRGMLPPGSTMPFGPLWFLGVYIAVVLICPWTIALHRRFGWWIPAICVLGALAVDFVGFGHGVHGVRYANVVFVLLFPHQLGYFYADGSLQKLSRTVFITMTAIGIGALVVLTNPFLFSAIGGARRFTWFPEIGHYPRSLLGTDVETISNAYPPTLCYLFVGIWMIGAVMLLQAPLTRWLQGRRPWKVVIFANSIVMSLFLWHMTAFLLAVLALWPLGFGHGAGGGTRWWIERPLWIAVPGVILAVLVTIFGRFERGRARA